MGISIARHWIIRTWELRQVGTIYCRGCEDRRRGDGEKCPKYLAGLLGRKVNLDLEVGDRMRWEVVE